MRSPSRHGLIYITGSTDTFQYRAFAKALRTEPVGLRQLTPEHFRLDPDIVIDIDLRNSVTVRRLTSFLSKRGTGCRIFLVDPTVPALHAEARALGADTILSPSCDPAVIHRAIRQFHNFSTDVMLTRSIETGIAALEGGFRTLLNNEIFDTAGMEDASNQIIDAIDSAGVDEWIATVRGYHVGTFQHCMLVTATASNFARKLGMRRSDVIKITAAALVHDIGKSAIPISILDKNGPLTPAEVQKVQEHPAIGHNYLAKKSRVAADALTSVRSHHEYLDGTGYPDRLRGSEIDDITRMVTISDIYAAMVERRAYKPPKSPAEAIAVLEGLAVAGKLELALVREFGKHWLCRKKVA